MITARLGSPVQFFGSGRRVEDRQRQPGEVGVGGRPRLAEGLAGRGADRQAALLDLRRDLPEAERLDDLKRLRHLRVVGQVLAGVGPEVVGPDARRPRAGQRPAVALLRTQRAISTVTPDRSGATSSCVTTAPTRPLAATSRSRAARGSTGLLAEQVLQGREPGRGGPGVERLAGPARARRALDADEPQAGVERDLGRRPRASQADSVSAFGGKSASIETGVFA